MDLTAMQSALAQRQLDGWLFWDFRGSDPVGQRILGLPADAHHTRRWCYFVPTVGEPTRIVHAIEPGALDGLPGRSVIYLRWQKLHELVGQTLAGKRRIAMQYSPLNAIPYVSRVDAGAVELVRSCQVEIESSADLVSQFEATLTAAQHESHCQAANLLGQQVNAVFQRIEALLRAGADVTEFAIQSWMMDWKADHRLVTDHPPIVAVNANAANPHYAPSATASAPIRTGDLILIDTWAKLDQPASIYGDITWMGFAGRSVPAGPATAFAQICAARDAAVAAVQQSAATGQKIRGCDVDDACRGVLEAAGVADYFIHRTGHSIHESTHGNGANIDNLETNDRRELIPRTVFSVEPGLYYPGQFGVRTEIDVYIDARRQPCVTGPPPQTTIRTLEVPA